MIAQFSVAAGAARGCFRSWRLWLVQFLANLALFGVFTLWLLIPVANAWQIVLNVLVALVLLGSVLVLHGGTLSYFASQDQDETVGLVKIFRRAAQNLPALFIGAVVFVLVWYLAGMADKYESLPNYLRSISPAFLRNVTRLSAYETLVNAGLFALQWILVSGLVLPLLGSTSSHGLGGFARLGIGAWKKCVTSLAYWLVIAAAAVLGVYATEKIMGWTPDFRTSTFRHETASIIWRGVVSYFLALFAWMLVCSMVGRFIAATANTRNDVAGQTGT